MMTWLHGLRQRLRGQAARSDLALNPLFDADWYVARYPDVRASGIDPYRHYARHGAAEGRDPNPLFSTNWYLAQYPQVARSGMNPLDHYLYVGADAGMDPSPLFDSDWYLDQNADVRAERLNPLFHFLRWGAIEGRPPRDGHVELPPLKLPTPSTDTALGAAIGLPDIPRQQPWQLRTAKVVVVIDEHVPEYDRSAGGLAIAQYLWLLMANGYSVTFMPHDGDLAEPYTSALYLAGITLVAGQPQIRDWFHENGDSVGWVLCARPAVATAYLRLVRKATRARLIYFTHDLHFVREARRYEIDRRPDVKRTADRLRRIEGRIIRSVDAVITPSSDEARVIREIAPDKEVHVVPLHFFSPAAIVAVDAQDPPLSRRRGVAFVAGFRHQPNVDAARFLVQEVMPRVWQEVPDAQVLVIGADPPAEIQALAGERVEVTGYLPDLQPAYARARMSVSPLRFGAGVKGKLLQSLAAGVPVVTTTLGNEGIDLQPGLEAMIGDNAESIARAVVTLFRDDALLVALAKAGQEVIRSRYTQDGVNSALLAALGPGRSQQLRPKRSGVIRRLTCVLAGRRGTRTSGGVEQASLEICPDPIFIVGSPRSGTTVLAQALNLHPSLRSSGESYLLHELYGAGRARKAFEFSRSASIGSWLAEGEVDFNEFLRYAGIGFNALFTSRSKGLRWIDHTPHYVLMADALLEMFPGGKFINVVRDGRLVVNSMINFGRRLQSEPGAVHIPRWTTDFVEACTTWRRYVEAGLQLAETYPERCHTLTNEALKADPEAIVKELVDFLGLEPDERVADYLRDNRVNSSFGAGARTPTSDPWATWTDEQRRTFVDEAGPTLIRCGYATATDLEIQ